MEEHTRRWLRGAGELHRELMSLGMKKEAREYKRSVRKAEEAIAMVTLNAHVFGNKIDMAQGK
jgi:hypothetical protein